MTISNNKYSAMNLKERMKVAATAGYDAHNTEANKVPYHCKTYRDLTDGLELGDRWAAPIAMAWNEGWYAARFDKKFDTSLIIKKALDDMKKEVKKMIRMNLATKEDAIKDFVASGIMTIDEANKAFGRKPAKRKSAFEKWLDTLIKEKNINLSESFTVQGELGWNYMSLQNVVDMIKQTGKREQEGIKRTLIKIDFRNGDVIDYFKHLSQKIAV